MARLCDDERRWGPLKWGTSSWGAIRLVLSSGDEDDPVTTITAYAGYRIIQLRLPPVLRPFRIKREAKYWSAADVKRMGRNWYYETHSREYGFSLSDGFLQLFFGPQTNDSETTKSWSAFLPWTQWTHVRESFYDLDGHEVSTFPGSASFEQVWEARARIPRAAFQVVDYDGQEVTATTFIREMEWLRGTGWFKWLSHFTKPMVRRRLEIEFSDEVGPDKGSWKGGLVGTTIELKTGELHLNGIRRFCQQTHRSKNGDFKLVLKDCRQP